MVIDSTIFIEHLRAKDQTKTVLASLPVSPVYYVSVVTKFEVFSGATDNNKWVAAEAVFSNLVVLPFLEDAALLAAKIKLDLRKRGLNIEYRDIFIGASALLLNLPLKTLNVKDFSKIPGLQLA